MPNLKSQNFSQDMANCQLKPQDVALHKVSVGGPLGSVKPRSNALLSGQVVLLRERFGRFWELLLGTCYPGVATGG